MFTFTIVYSKAFISGECSRIEKSAASDGTLVFTDRGPVQGSEAILSGDCIRVGDVKFSFHLAADLEEQVVNLIANFFPEKRLNSDDDDSTFCMRIKRIADVLLYSKTCDELAPLKTSTSKI